MNTFNLTLSGKHFICPSILNDSFAWGFFCFVFLGSVIDSCEFVVILLFLFLIFFFLDKSL